MLSFESALKKKATGYLSAMIAFGKLNLTTRTTNTEGHGKAKKGISVGPSSTSYISKSSTGTTNNAQRRAVH
jgi:hypothetical protein